jgi:hypothetical protein
MPPKARRHTAGRPHVLLIKHTRKGTPVARGLPRLRCAAVFRELTMGKGNE